MIDAPYKPVSFQETVTCLEAAREKLRDLAKKAWLKFLESWRTNSADEHKQMNMLVEEALTLARQTIDSVSDDMLKVASDQSMTMGSFYHTRGGMPSRGYELYMYLGGARSDFQSRKELAERNMARAKAALTPYLGDEAITWEQYKQFTEGRYTGFSDPLDRISDIGDEFYVMTLILNKVPEHLQQSHEMMLRDFKAGNKKARRK